MYQQHACNALGTSKSRMQQLNAGLHKRAQPLYITNALLHVILALGAIYNPWTPASVQDGLYPLQPAIVVVVFS